ncbi:MAG: thiolase family protein [Dehalococcoidia bacterium]|nr:thiolase family protein [Dehalococcoidia bacterium]
MVEWLRGTEDVGIWEHRGKVALVGRGHSPVDRRWDGKDMSTTLGALSVMAAKLAMEDAGITPDQIDGVVTCPGGQSNGGLIGAAWGPGRPYFDPPYDTEDGLSKVTAEWLVRELGLTNAKYVNSQGDNIFMMMGQGAQAVGDGQCSTLLIVYPTGNLEGRYQQNTNTDARGAAQWSSPWGWGMPVAYPFAEYCRKYGTNHDRMAPFIVNSRRNGLMVPWGYYALHEPYQLTTDDYLNARWICEPLSMLDCDRPVQASAGYIMTTADRAKDLKQKPVYVLDYTSSLNRNRSSIETLDDTEAWTQSMATKVWNGSGLKPSDIDVFNPYDGFALFTQYYLEAFQWHGVKRGEAHDFYAGDISVEGPHPFLSSGGNIGTGRTRTSIFTDCMEQLQGRAGPRQIRGKREIALAGGVLPGNAGWTVFSSIPDA